MRTLDLPGGSRDDRSPPRAWGTAGMANDAKLAEQNAPDGRREALLAEYSEVADNFRLLTNIRFKLLALLPIAAGGATALLSAGASRNGASEVRALVLSLFGLLITLGLTTYNARNDQLYDTLVGRAASIEWELGLFDGAFANRPIEWLSVSLPVLRWPIGHRFPVALIYGASVGLWIFGVVAAVVRLAWPNHSPPPGVLVAATAPAIAVPIVAAWRIGTQRKEREEAMCTDAVAAMKSVLEHRGVDRFPVRRTSYACARS